MGAAESQMARRLPVQTHRRAVDGSLGRVGRDEIAAEENQILAMTEWVKTPFSLNPYKVIWSLREAMSDTEPEEEMIERERREAGCEKSGKMAG